MKRMFLFCVLLMFTANSLLAQGPYRLVSIREIQTISIDSLKLADTLNYTATTRWTLQTSPLFKTPRETVEVVGQVVVPPGIFTAQVKGFNMILKRYCTREVKNLHIFLSELQ